MSEWLEVGGNHLVPIITADLKRLVSCIRAEVENMNKKDLAWLKLASENISRLCQAEIARRNDE